MKRRRGPTFKYPRPQRRQNNWWEEVTEHPRIKYQQLPCTPFLHLRAPLTTRFRKGRGTDQQTGRLLFALGTPVDPRSVVRPVYVRSYIIRRPDWTHQGLEGRPFDSGSHDISIRSSARPSRPSIRPQLTEGRSEDPWVRTVVGGVDIESPTEKGCRPG